MVSVLVADDNAMFRRAIRALLVESGRFDVLDEAASGDEAAVLAERLRPDLVLMDIAMAGSDGITAARCLWATCPTSKVILVSSLECREVPDDAWSCGAIGYLAKDDLTPDRIERLYREGAAYSRPPGGGRLHE